jgi:hypothetical protein
MSTSVSVAKNAIVFRWRYDNIEPFHECPLPTTPCVRRASDQFGQAKLSANRPPSGLKE